MQDSWLSSVMLPVHSALADRGLDADRIALNAGIARHMLHDPNARIPFVAAKNFWIAAVEAVESDPCFGLDVAMHFTPTSFHAVGFAWMASGSLREATQRLIRYYRVVSEIDRLVTREEGGLAWLIFQTDGDYSLHGSHDARLASLLRLGRALVGNDFAPAAVRLPHPRPMEAERLIAFFGVEPEWDTKECAIAVPFEDLDRRLPTGNTELALAAEKIAADYLVRHACDDIPARVRRALIDLLPSGRFSRQAVASTLAMSGRTLQRRLVDQDLSFAGLVEAVRQELARDYLRDSRHSIHEIAFLLGFTELASFSRAFRRWTGVAPSIWREEQLAA
jgi:AraC-like DNA-binding protein